MSLIQIAAIGIGGACVAALFHPFSQWLARKVWERTHPQEAAELRAQKSGVPIGLH